MKKELESALNHMGKQAMRNWIDLLKVALVLLLNRVIGVVENLAVFWGLKLSFRKVVACLKLARKLSV